MSTIRPLDLADAPALFAAVDCSRDALRRWMEWYHDAYSLSDAETWITHTLAARSEGTGFHFAIVEADGRLVGTVGLEDVNPASRAMLGYWIATPETRRGVATRSVGEALRWAQTNTGIRTVWAVAAELNAPSRRVLTANGFHRVGVRGIDSRGDVPLLYELEVRTAKLPSER
jgi:RimJ/RimL family protein N-acetyltransferase